MTEPPVETLVMVTVYVALISVAVQFGLFVPPPEPKQIQIVGDETVGKAGEAGEGVPDEQKVSIP
jgi:hypothetical protein